MEQKKSILFVGHCYYNNWYLSNELKKIGWDSKVINIDPSPNSSMYYHGEDFKFHTDSKEEWKNRLTFYLNSISNYSIFHFSNTNNIHYYNFLDNITSTNRYESQVKRIVYILSKYIYKKRIQGNKSRLSKYRRVLGDNNILRILKFIAPFLPHRWDILLIKHFGGKITYTNNGCHDGVLQSSFSKWSTPTGEAVCDICPWKNVPYICSDKKMRIWGEFRNKVADYICILGGNRADYNLAPNVHETPYVYCLNKEFWNPDLMIPSNYLLPIKSETIKIYHAVGNYDSRVHSGNKNIKSTHIYIEVIKQLKKDGFDVELIFFKDVPNKSLRYYQLQADIFVDMLSVGFYGATIREGMMLGKPCVCYLREEWLEQAKAEIPEFVSENPVISATENTIYNILKELILNKDKRSEIGKKSRQYALKWYASDVAASKMDKIYADLIS